MGPLPSAIAVSLRASLISIVAASIIGIPVGLVLFKSTFKGKKMLIAMINSLMAVPTVVIGLFVYTLIRREALLGEFHMLFSLKAIVLGQIILAIPIMISFSHAAFGGLDPAAMETVKTYAASPLFAGRTLVGEARYGILAAVSAGFGRLIGEIGISMMLGGNIIGVTRTMTTAIALETSKGNFLLGIQLGIILLLMALGVNLLLNLLNEKAAG